MNNSSLGQQKSPWCSKSQNKQVLDWDGRSVPVISYSQKEKKGCETLFLDNKLFLKLSKDSIRAVEHCLSCANNSCIQSLLLSVQGLLRSTEWPPALPARLVYWQGSSQPVHQLPGTLHEAQITTLKLTKCFPWNAGVQSVSSIGHFQLGNLRNVRSMARE